MHTLCPHRIGLLCIHCVPIGLVPCAGRGWICKGEGLDMYGGGAGHVRRRARHGGGVTLVPPLFHVLPSCTCHLTHLPITHLTHLPITHYSPPLSTFHSVLFHHCAVCNIMTSLPPSPPPPFLPPSLPPYIVEYEQSIPSIVEYEQSLNGIQSFSLHWGFS